MSGVSRIAAGSDACDFGRGLLLKEARHDAGHDHRALAVPDAPATITKRGQPPALSCARLRSTACAES